MQYCTLLYLLVERLEVLRPLLFALSTYTSSQTHLLNANLTHKDTFLHMLQIT